MISKRQVSESIDKTAAEIEWCWHVIIEFKSSNGASDLGIKDFQNRLIGALWKLDDLYREIHAERRRLINKKAELKYSWFKTRMATLESYRHAVREAISIAKAVGDGFAWIFYARERELIDAHLKSPRQLHLPPKIGRIGERAFVENFQVLEGKLVLYHGITTFLRMGDVSFYDFTQRRIANIGELKTEHLGGSEYRINLSFVYGGRFSPVVDVSKIARATDGTSKMNPHHASRLSRQLKQISAMIKEDGDYVKRSTSQQTTFYFAELNTLIEASRNRAMGWKKVGRGLLIGALRLRNDGRLSSRLLSKKFHIGKKLDGASEAAQSIMDPALSDNALLLSNLGASERGISGLMRGTVPLFWWPIKTENLRDLVFGNVITMTLYNPAHFWQALRTKGFEVTIGERARLASAKMRIGQRRAELHNLDYFQTLITHYLMSEDDIISMIDGAIEFPSPDDGRAMRVEIRPQLRF